MQQKLGKVSIFMQQKLGEVNIYMQQKGKLCMIVCNRSVWQVNVSLQQKGGQASKYTINNEVVQYIKTIEQIF